MQLADYLLVAVIELRGVSLLSRACACFVCVFIACLLVVLGGQLVVSGRVHLVLVHIEGIDL